MRALIVMTVLALGCTRANPAFDVSAYDAGASDDRAGTADRPLGVGPKADAPAALDSGPPPDAPAVRDAAVSAFADAADPDPLDLLPGLLGYWRFDDAPGSGNATDHSGNERHGDLEASFDPSSAWTEGKWGGALDFPGGSGAHAVAIPADSVLDGLERLTIAAWALRTGSGPDRHMSVISRHIGAGPRDVFNLSFYEDRLAVYLDGPNGSNPLLSLEPSTITPFGIWIHVAVTYDGATVRLYLEGEEIGSVGRTGALATSTNPILIGTNRNPGNNEAMMGRLDEVLLYDRVLPPESIAALAAGSRPPVP